MKAATGCYGSSGCRGRGSRSGFGGRRPAWAGTNPRRGSGRILSSAVESSPCGTHSLPAAPPACCPDSSGRARRRIIPSGGQPRARRESAGSAPIRISYPSAYPAALRAGAGADRHGGSSQGPGSCPPPGTSAAATASSGVDARRRIARAMLAGRPLVAAACSAISSDLYPGQADLCRPVPRRELWSASHRLDEEIRVEAISRRAAWARLRKGTCISGAMAPRPRRWSPRRRAAASRPPPSSVILEEDIRARFRKSAASAMTAGAAGSEGNES